MDIVLKFENQGSDAWVRIYKICKRKWGQPSNEGGKHTPGVEEKQMQNSCCNTAEEVQRLERKFGGSSSVA